MNKLHQIVSNILASSTNGLVIGYEMGTGGRRRPAFVSSIAELERLVFDSDCKHNLSTYLTKPEYKQIQHIILFATPSTIRSVIRLAGENQLKGRELTFIIIEGNDFRAVQGLEALAEYAGQPKIYPSQEHEELLAKIEHMTREERFAFWKEQFSSCIKCYACRAACPMCYCSRCTVEQNQPQWISAPSNLQGNFEYHIMRAMHMAGRCVDCGMCESACPLGLPLNIVTRRMIKDIEANIGADILTMDSKNVLNVFQPGDKENFIQ